MNSILESATQWRIIPKAASTTPLMVISMRPKSDTPIHQPKTFQRLSWTKIHGNHINWWYSMKRITFMKCILRLRFIRILLRSTSLVFSKTGTSTTPKCIEVTSDNSRMRMINGIRQLSVKKPLLMLATPLRSWSQMNTELIGRNQDGWHHRFCHGNGLTYLIKDPSLSTMTGTKLNKWL